MSWTADVRGFTSGTPFRPAAPNIATHNAQAQAADPGSLLNFYKAMLALRNTQPALARGRYEAPLAQGRVLSFQRAYQGQRVLVVINYGQEAAKVALSGLTARRQLRPLYPTAATPPGRAPVPAPRVDPAGRLTLMAAPLSVQVFRLR
ncbi:hypothetical protein CS062_14935 [Roseateles chitinivorans]|uniref:Glycosyl hydrolase family 13 catalytic domain-containing protein n=2 Tax=Roseateles chitinivorans TaxID=2917965 RepID=A0A2G9C9T0_9BURK|nr:hypothetical protein CS062_14935 [Roseateles chitinivorans]